MIKIVRKKSPNGRIFGPFMMVLEETRTHVVCEDIEGSPCRHVFTKKGVVNIPAATLSISEDMMMRLKMGANIHVQHEATATWIKALKKNINVVQFMTRKNYNYALFTVMAIEEISYSHRGKFIRIVVGRQIM